MEFRETKLRLGTTGGIGKRTAKKEREKKWSQTLEITPSRDFRNFVPQ
jgi:hypothetical protein